MTTPHHAKAPGQRWKASGAMLTVALLTACGGGGAPSDAFVSGTEVPIKATQSPSEAVAFVQSGLVTTNETMEPVNVGDIALATSETDEPTDV